MADNDVFERFIKREELLRSKEHALLKALAECHLDVSRTGAIRPGNLAVFDVALAELSSWLDKLTQEMHDEPLLDEHESE